MNFSRFTFIVVCICSYASKSEATATLLVQVSDSNATGDEIEKFLNEAISFFRTLNNITARIDDVNECESSTLNKCAKHATCTNLNGSYRCECPSTSIDENPSSPGTNCTDIDECKEQTHVCSVNADCFDVINGYVCFCKSGYIGDGRNCSELTTTTQTTAVTSSFVTPTTNAEAKTVEAPGSDTPTVSDNTPTPAPVIESTTQSLTSTKDASTFSPSDAGRIDTTAHYVVTSEGQTTMNDVDSTTQDQLYPEVSSSGTSSELIYTTKQTRSTSSAASSTTAAPSKQPYSPITTPETIYTSTHMAPATASNHTTTTTPLPATEPSNAHSMDTGSTNSKSDAAPTVPTTETVPETTSTQQFTANYKGYVDLTTQATMPELTDSPNVSDVVTSVVTSNPIEHVTSELHITSRNAKNNSTQTTTNGSTESTTSTRDQKTEIPVSTERLVTTVNGTDYIPAEAVSASVTTVATALSDTTNQHIEEISTASTDTSTNDKATTQNTDTTQPPHADTTTTTITTTTTTSKTPTSVGVTTSVNTTAHASVPVNSTQSNDSVNDNTATQSTLSMTTQPSPATTTTVAEITTTIATTVSRTERSTYKTTGTADTSTASERLTSAETTTGTSSSTDSQSSAQSTTNAQLSRSSTGSSTATDINDFVPSSTGIFNQVTTARPPVPLPSYDGNSTAYLNDINTVLATLNADPTERLDIDDANSAVDAFEDMLLGGNTEASFADTAAGIFNAFSDASVEGGKVVVNSKQSAKITRFLSSALESMELPAGGKYTKTEENLVLEAQDVDFSNTETAVFSPSAGSVVLPRAFVLGSDQVLSRNAASTQRLAFTQYSDSRFFATANVGFVPAGGDQDLRAFSEATSIINTPVVGASVGGRSVVNSTEQATIKLNLLISDVVENQLENGTKEVISFTGSPKCVWWNYNTSDWSESGCVLQGFENATVTCQCNHLTSFAVIMTVEKAVEDEVLEYLSYVGAGLSITGLILTIITYSIFRTLRKSRSKRILLHFCVALCCVYITYVLGIAAKLPANQSQCIASGFFMHFFTLAVMAWMSVEVVDMYIMFVRVMRVSFNKYLLKAGLIAWLIPFALALIPLIIHLAAPGLDIYPTFEAGNSVCWLGKAGMLYAFIIPSCIILMVNLVLFTIVLRNVTCKRGRGLVGRIGRRSGKNIKASQHVINALALLLLAGPTWIIGYFINVEPVEDGVFRRILSYVFVILNAFQGFWIFIVFCARPPSVRRRWMQLIRSGKLDDRSHIYSSTSSQRQATKPTTMSPRTSISPAVAQTVNGAGHDKLSVATTSSNSSSNSNNSRAKILVDNSVSPHDSPISQQRLWTSNTQPVSTADTRVETGKRRQHSVSSYGTVSVANSEISKVVTI